MKSAIAWLQPSPWFALGLATFLLPWLPAVGGIVLAGLLFYQTYQWGRNPDRRTRETWAWFLLVLGLVGTCVLARRPGEAWLGLANFLPYMALYGVTISLFQVKDRLIPWAALVVIPSPTVAIWGMWQLIRGDRYYGEAETVSVFDAPNICATYLTLTLTLGMGLWILSYRQRDWRSLGGWSLALLVDALGILFTGSRTAWAAILGIALLFALYLSWRLLSLTLIALTSLIATAAFGGNTWRDRLGWLIPSYISQKLDPNLQAEKPFYVLRTTVWGYALQLSEDRPLWGWGLRNFPELYEAHTGFWYGHPHNFWLLLAAETGWPITLLFTLLIALPLVRGVQTLQALGRSHPEHPILFAYLIAFASVAAANLSDVTIFDLRTNVLAWLLLAAIQGSGSVQSSGQIAPHRGGSVGHEAKQF